MEYKSPIAIRVVLSLLFLISVTGIATAQFRAAVQGTVKDTTGGVIPGATVTVTSLDTNLTRETTTGDTGTYRISALAPGRYTVKVSLAGFREQVVTDVVVSAEETRGLDVTLEPGGVQESITVSSENTGIQTENGDISTAISKQEVQALPQVGRDPYELIRLAPGVFGLGQRNATGGSLALPNNVGPGGSNDQIFATENRPGITAAGQRVEANNIQIDGVNAMSQAWGGAAVVTPNQESVKEVRVLANNYTAEYGRNTGAQIQVVSQTGTNDFHGSLFLKRNAPGLNSVQDFVQAGTALRESPQRVNQLLSQWGGSVGGPVVKDRLFFFGSYERVDRNSNHLAAQWIATSEFESAVKGLSNSLAANIINFPAMTAPRVASVNPPDCAAAGFTIGVNCNPVGSGLDIGSINPAAVRGAIQPGIGGGLDGVPDMEFAQLNIPDKTKAQQVNARVDFQATESDLVAFSMYFVPNTRTFGDPGNQSRSGLDYKSARRNMVGTLLWSKVLGGTTVNEARLNATRWYFDEIASNPNIGWGIPNINVCGAQCVHFGNQIGPGVFYQTTYNFRDTLSKVVNAHALKFGGDVIDEQNNDTAPWAGRPTFQFGNLWNFANDAPTSENAFFDPATGAFTNLAAYARSRYYSLFVQDDWKLRPNFTLNLGLRWEYFTPTRSANDRIANLVLGPGGSLTDARIQTGGDLFKPDKNNFGPQIGFAWSPGSFSNRLVIRGGAGVGFNRLPGSRLLDNRFNPPFFANFNFDQPSGNIVYGLAGDLNGFNFPVNPNATLTLDPTTGIPITGAPVSMSAALQDIRQPYAYRQSLGLEYDLGGNWVASIEYQGSAAHKLPRSVPYHLFVTPNPRLSSVNLLMTDVNSSFNGLLTGIQHRFSKGVGLNAEYRWSKSIDTCSNDHACNQTYPFDQTTERGPSDFDVRHAFKGFATWELPFFGGRNDAVSKVLGGWELSGIVTASSGFPWTPVVGGGQCSAVVAGGGVCPLRPIAEIKPPANTDTSNDTFLGAGQFPGGGLAYFTPPPAGSFTVVPLPGVGRNSFRGPRYFSTDMTVLKRFGFPNTRVLGENAGIEIRANLYNLFNRLNLEPFRVNDDNTQIQNPAFGRALHALSGRVAEFQARFSF